MILVFGSINADLIVPVPRLPLPGETVLGGDYALLPGGKGANQALAARRAGARVAMAGAVGNDVFAPLTLANLRAAGVDLALVREARRPTGCALIMVGAGGQLRVPALAIAPVDTTGAGDTFAGVLAAGIERGLALAAALREASAAAALACLATGAQTAMPDRASIAEAVGRLSG